MKSITIKKLKGIKELHFNIPDKNGVYLLAGSNGCGKTTLLTCLDRICHGYAFQNGFSTSNGWSSADQYSNARISYSINNNTVCFRKANNRWTATPRVNSTFFFSQFGFSSSIYIKADSKRIDTKKEDIKKGNIIDVDKNVITTLNNMFENEKFQNLKRLKNSYGRGRTSVFFYLIQDGKSYYSEKRFSTGELAMLRMVEQLETVSENGLVLLDEAELALHPRVQYQMLQYLRKKAEEKKLWVFIATHSPTLLKIAEKEEIFLLQDEEDVIKVVNPCYPAHAIGDIDYDISNIFDYVFFVEDDMAKNIFEAMRKRYISISSGHNTALCFVIPVGGFYETALFAVKSNIRMLGNSKVYAILDADAFDGMDKKPKFSELYNDLQNKNIIKSLTFTPEVMFIDKLENCTKKLDKDIYEEFNIHIKTIIQSCEYQQCNSTKIRELSKKKFGIICKRIGDAAATDKNQVCNKIINMIADNMKDGDILRVFNPLFG